MPGGSDSGKWLLCNGQDIDPVTYPKLAALMSKVPNYQGVFLRGYGSQGYSQLNGSKIGITETLYSSAELNILQGDAIRNITGQVATTGILGVGGTGSFYSSTSTNRASTEAGYYGNAYLNFDASLIIPTSNENRPVNIAVNYLIKAK